MDDCIFCRIVKKEIKSEIVFENEYVIALKDIDPKAPVHLLIIPKKHIVSINDINKENLEVICKIFETIPIMAKKFNLKSYRIVSNHGEESGQSVFHLHIHLLGGRVMGWPPG